MLKPGDSFERYTIEAPLGQGGMGCVYRAHDPRLGRRVAVKVISDAAAREGGSQPQTPRAEANARLVREARAAAALDHPNAVAIFDVGELDGAPYIVMELVEGRTLRSAMGDAAVPVPTRVAQLADVARALAGAHRRGLVHRDIKPENVMVRDDGMVKVLDFGIARRSGCGVDPHGATQTPALPTLTVDGVKLGTPVYMAPEQIRGDTLDGRADQFSWGVLAHELLAGRLPWRGAGDAFAVMASVLTDPVDGAALEQAGVPPAVQQVVLRALAKRPEDRFASMDDLLRALDAAARGAASDPAPKMAQADPLSGVRQGARQGGQGARQGGQGARQGVTEAQSFSTAEVRAVLGQAIEQQAQKHGSTKLGFEDLLAVAAEVGVDADSLREASRALRLRGDEQSAAAADLAKRNAWLRRQRLLFYRHAGIYLIVNAALLVLGLVLLLAFTPWWVWFLPGLAWGIGLAIHGLVALTSNEDDWKEERDRMQWWLDQRQRRHEERMAAIGAARKIPDAIADAIGGGRRERKRVEAPAEQAREKVRVAATDTGHDTGRERVAEEEAAVAEQREPGRRRR